MRCLYKSVNVLVVLILILQINVIECRRYSGSGGRRPTGGSRPSPSHPSPSHPSPTSHPSPNHNQRPSSDTHNSNTQNNQNNQNIGWKNENSAPSAPVGPPVNSKPLGNSPQASAPVSSDVNRPLGFQPPGAPPPYSPGGHVQPPPYSPGNGGYHPGAPPAYHPGAPPAYHPGAPPAYHPGAPPSYQQGGYNPNTGYHPQQGGYYPQNGYHPPGVNVINNNINYGSPPIPSYHYSSHDTGSGTLGFFLGYGLAKLTSPSIYHSSNSYDGYSPRYDHYTVHHYYHNKDDVPKEKVIEPNTIVGCVGDSGTICPANTTSLCTNNGAIMCVASALTTVPCLNDRQMNCVKSTVPCVNNTSPECKNNAQNSTTVTIPCVSTAKIYGTVTTVNNSIVIQNSTMNSTNTSTNLDSNNSTVSSGSSTTEVPTTTTSTTTTTTVSSKNSEPQNFCVTILALPAVRQPSDAEKAFDQAEIVFDKFVIKAFGLE